MAATPVWAGVAMLMPLAEQYEIGRFVYRPPATDGWRAVGQAPDELHLVYAEMLDQSDIAMRVDVVIHAFDVEDPSVVPDPPILARLSHQQQAAKRKGSLVALSNVEPVPGAENMYAFTLVSRGPKGDYFERFYVALAPDRTQYVVAKVTTDDPAYEQAPYWAPLVESMAGLKYRAPGGSGGAGQGTGEAAGEESPAKAPAGGAGKPAEQGSVARDGGASGETPEQ
ncbi:MAG: hypothetical protein D6815_00985 [Candidatus Dadabacteria bacterium]|nr:MAG: hypothetical protein D6815_00985 [Candidatus Dadabacteria bacterium]